MVVGENNDLALGYENDEGGDGGASSGLADSGNNDFPNTISSSNTNVDSSVLWGTGGVY